jgi:hypothetical protein
MASGFSVGTERKLKLFRATVNKGPWTKSLGTNLKHIEPWIGPFFTLLKTIFFKGRWVCLKVWGPIWGSNIKNMWLICERIRLTFDFFSFFHGFFNLLFTLSFMNLDWKRWKCTLSSNHLARIHKTSHINSKIDPKMGELLCFQQYPRSIHASSIFIEFEQQRFFFLNEKKRKRNEKVNNLEP